MWNSRADRIVGGQAATLLLGGFLFLVFPAINSGASSVLCQNNLTIRVLTRGDELSIRYAEVLDSRGEARMKDVSSGLSSVGYCGITDDRRR